MPKRDFLALFSSFSWVLHTQAQYQGFAPFKHDELTYTIRVPESTAHSGDGPLYFQMNTSRPIEWFALGQGAAMHDSRMFVVYTSGDNVTLSPRAGKGHYEPLYDKTLRASLISGTGVHDGTLTANVRCDNCKLSPSRATNLNYAFSPWIWAIKFGASLGTLSLTAKIAEHDAFGVFYVNLTKATGPDNDNPLLNIDRRSITKAWTQPFDHNGFDRKRTAHAVLMTLAFVLFFPLAALTLHLLKSPQTVRIHASIQLFTLAMTVAGFGLGVSMAKDVHILKHHHAIVGFVVVCCLVLFQPLMGLLQHRHFKKSGGKGPFAYFHRWLGRAMIILGVINVGLGFELTGIGSSAVPRGAVIAYGTVAGVLGLMYIVVIVGKAARRGCS
ncbi:hypothetical protein N7539_005964 [Penicillium diatomitis]|uniref:Cytochrome b561 domain-containing protein n=1 Tax=Penicillium diatomitis TaxID=2819901 RepID=A0A9W9X5P0_9EURO|nr:uncharacterized protein N7539_005964 [Penicillium diatomitis]KAJ5484168.1 hypothetical protein N7539_005964 [Penicillium diatomitis]